MRKQQRRDSAREWIRSGANVTVRTYAKRYGVDSYTAYDDDWWIMLDGRRFLVVGYTSGGGTIWHLRRRDDHGATPGDVLREVRPEHKRSPAQRGE
jgi:hypothetical protein